MKKHFNLYYLLLEEKRNTERTKKQIDKAKRIIEEFYKKIKLSLPALPEKEND